MAKIGTVTGSKEGRREMGDELKPHVTNSYDPDSVYVYGIETTTISVADHLDYVTANVAISVGKNNLKMVAVYGYGYQGQCYTLPKPKILIAKADVLNGAKYAKFDEACGYSAKAGYACYQLRSTDHFSFLDLSSGDVKEKILDENMPGKRSPLAYAQAMSQSHRGS